MVLPDTYFVKDTLFDPQPHLELRPVVHRRFDSGARLANVALTLPFWTLFGKIMGRPHLTSFTQSTKRERNKTRRFSQSVFLINTEDKGEGLRRFPA